MAFVFIWLRLWKQFFFFFAGFGGCCADLQNGAGVAAACWRRQLSGCRFPVSIRLREDGGRLLPHHLNRRTCEPQTSRRLPTRDGRPLRKLPLSRWGEVRSSCSLKIAICAVWRGLAPEDGNFPAGRRRPSSGSVFTKLLSSHITYCGLSQRGIFGQAPADSRPYFFS